MACGKCDFFYHLNAAPAAGAFLYDPQGRVLWIRRAKDPGLGKLGLPGGFVDAGESAEAALRREIREEVGLEVSQLDFLASYPNVYPFRGIVYDTIDLFFSARLPSLEGAKAFDEVAGLVIRKVEEISLDEIAFVSIRQAAQVFQKTVRIA